MARKLSKVVMIRVTPQDAKALRRWARTHGSDVSKVIRSFIDQRMAEEQRQGAVREESQPEGIAA